MPTTLLQNTATDVTVFLETIGGSAATGIVSSGLTLSLKKASDAFFTPKTLTDPVAATATIGSGSNGTVTVSVPGSAGNSYTIEVVVPSGTAPLSYSKTGSVLVVSLSVSGGVPVPADNSATAIAQLINALGVEATATASGTGADPLGSAEGPTTLTGGSDGSFTELGSGFYKVSLLAADTDTVGNLYLQVVGSGLQSFAEGFYVAPSSSLGSSSTPTTSVFGTILDVTGNAVVGAAVTFKAVPVPSVVHPGSFGLGIDSSIVTVSTDTNGYFVTSLITGTFVDVSIPVLSYRKTIKVPESSTADLFSL